MPHIRSSNSHKCYLQESLSKLLCHLTTCRGINSGFRTQTWLLDLTCHWLVLWIYMYSMAWCIAVQQVGAVFVHRVLSIWGEVWEKVFLTLVCIAQACLAPAPRRWVDAVHPYRYRLWRVVALWLINVPQYDRLVLCSFIESVPYGVGLREGLSHVSAFVLFHLLNVFCPGLYDSSTTAMDRHSSPLGKGCCPCPSHACCMDFVRHRCG